MTTTARNTRIGPEISNGTLFFVRGPERLGLVLAIASLCLSLACEEPSRDPADGESSISFSLPLDRIYLAPGDSFVMPVFATSRRGRVSSYQLAYVDPSHGPREHPNDTEIEFGGRFAAPGADLRISTSSTTDPGVYPIALEAAFLDEVETRTLEVVVVPTDQALRSEAIVEVSGGLSHTLALDENGDVWAWGRNDRGQLGDGTLVGRAVPVRVPGIPRAAVAIAAGDRHSLALLDDGTIAAWGDNDQRQVQPSARTADDTPDRRLVPELVENSVGDALAGHVAIAAGARHSVALRGDGAVRTFGSNARGALGNGASVKDTTVVDLEVADWVAVAAGTDFTLALEDDGSVWGWGVSLDGQIGGGIGTDDLFTPIDIGFTPPVAAIGAGAEHTLLVLDDGNVGSLGNNSWGQLGDGSRNRPVAQPFRPPFLVNVEATAGGALHSLAVQANRRVYAWGNNRFGQASDAGVLIADGAGSVDQLVPVWVTSVPPSAGIAAGARHSLSIDDSCGTLWSWGDDSRSQLGAGSVFPRGGHRPEPRPVIGLGETGLPSGCRVTLSIVVRGEGEVSASGTPIDDSSCDEQPCTAAVTLDGVVDLDAVPEPGSEFVRWSGQCDSTTAATTVVMDRGRNCLAHFNAFPIAEFRAEEEPLILPDLFGVRLLVDGSSDPDGEIVAYAWDLDDDGSLDETGVDVRFNPTVAGDYPIRLVVTDDQGARAEVVRIVRAVARISATILQSPESIRVGETAQFIAEERPEITQYVWDFDLDGVSDATGATVTHVFDTPGDQDIRLRVTSSEGAEGVAYRTVSVLPAQNGGPVTLTLIARGGGDGVVLTPDESFLCNFTGGTTTPSPCVATRPAGTSLHLIAFGSTGSVFSHWGVGECDSEPPGDPNPDCVVTLNGDRTIDVYFE